MNDTLPTHTTAPRANAKTARRGVVVFAPYLVSLAILTQSALAQVPPLGMKVTAGFDGAGRRGWMPIFVDLTNPTGEELDLTIEACALQSQPFRAVRSVTMPPKARKRCVLYLAWVPSKIVITARQGRMLLSKASLFPNPVGFQQAFAVSLSDLGYPISLPTYISNIWRRGNLTVTHGAMDVRTPSGLPMLPDRWIGYASVDFLAMHSSVVRYLSLAQQRAIADWVRMGGCLIVLPKPDPAWLRAPFFQDMAGFQIKGTREVVTRSGARYVQHTFAGKHMALLPTETATGAAAVFPSGMGHVILCSSDWSRGLFSGPASWRTAWQRVFRYPPFVQQIKRGADLEKSEELDEIWDVLDTVESGTSRMPSLRLMLAIILCYLVLVGPVNYLVLKRLRRTVLLIVSVPCIALLFVAAIFLLGYWTKGVHDILIRLAFTEIDGASGKGRRSSFIRLYATTPGSTDFTFGPSGVGLPLRGEMVNYVSFLGDVVRRYSYAYQRRRRRFTRRSDEVTALQTRGFRVRRWPMAMWTQNFVWGQRPVNIGGPITLREEVSRVVIANASSLVLRDALCFLRGAAGCVPIGLLKPGATVAAERPKGRINASTATVDKWLGDTAAKWPREKLADSILNRIHAIRSARKCNLLLARSDAICDCPRPTRPARLSQSIHLVFVVLSSPGT